MIQLGPDGRPKHPDKRETEEDFMTHRREGLCSGRQRPGRRGHKLRAAGSHQELVRGLWQLSATCVCATARCAPAS